MMRCSNLQPRHNYLGMCSFLFVKWMMFVRCGQASDTQTRPLFTLASCPAVCFEGIAFYRLSILSFLMTGVFVS